MDFMDDYDYRYAEALWMEKQRCPVCGCQLDYYEHEMGDDEFGQPKIGYQFICPCCDWVSDEEEL